MKTISLILFLSFFSVLNAQIPTAGLVAFYPFNGNTLDSSNLNNHAIKNGCTYSNDRFGNPNAAISLNGIADSIRFPIPEFAPIIGDFSISFWLKTTSPDKMNVFSSKQFHDDTTNNFEFQLTSNTIQNTILEVQYSSFTYWNGIGGNYLNCHGEGAHGKYYNGKWQHYVIQRKNDTIQIWNEKYATYPSVANYFGGTLGDAVDLVVGAGSNRYKGAIDDVVFYNRNISPNEIFQLYHDHKPFVFLSPKPTDAYVQGDTVIINWNYSDLAVGDSIALEYRLNNSGPWILSSQNQLVDWSPYKFPLNYPIGTTAEFRISDLHNPTTLTYSGQFRVSEYKWTQILDTLPFTNRDGVGLLNFQNKMWLIGGWDPPYHEENQYTTSEVWNSIDGINWTFVNEAPWLGRHCSGWLVHDSAMWVIGGDPQSNALRDVWKSTDGINWIQILDTIPNMTPNRTMHNVASLNGKIYNFGGQSTAYVEENLQQVWESPDGENWAQLPDAPWIGRGMMLNSCVDTSGTMWLLGGGRLWDRRCYNDVWKTQDGINWELVLESAPWQGRYWHNVAWFDNKMWVMNGIVNQTDNDETWYSENGIDWFELKFPKRKARHAASTTVFDRGVWVMAGIASNDVWKLQNHLTFDAGIKENKESDFSIYPNPSTNEINIENLNKETTYTITNAEGKWIQFGKTNGKINVSTIKSGIYYLKMEGKIQKIIIY